MIEVIAIFVCFVVLGLLFEKLIHLDYDIAGVTLALKMDIRKFIKAIISKPVVRHIFDGTLKDDFQAVTKECAKKGFGIKVMNASFRGVPVITIQFVPAHVLEESELQELVHVLLIKFREYMAYYGLTWQIFGVYYVGADHVTIYLHYAELECDRHPFISLYRQTVRRKTDKSSGVLRDEELEAELKRVR